jgi:hypothetical protein
MLRLGFEVLIEPSLRDHVIKRPGDTSWLTGVVSQVSQAELGGGSREVSQTVLDCFSFTQWTQAHWRVWDLLSAKLLAYCDKRKSQTGDKPRYLALAT